MYTNLKQPRQRCHINLLLAKAGARKGRDETTPLDARLRHAVGRAALTADYSS
jgi:hypothetical protein